MAKNKIKIFEDKAGNKLYKKPVKKVHTTWQLSATNNKGKSVGLKGVKALIGKAKRSDDKSDFWMNYSQKRGPETHIGIKISKSQRFLSKQPKVLSSKSLMKKLKTPKVLSSKPLKKVYK